MSFFEKHYKKIWFHKYKERVCFEQWIFTFQLTNEPKNKCRPQTLNMALRSTVGMRMIYQDEMMVKANNVT
ncbi:hypothetical protein QOT17_004526 [Balamuthia mandrillaris]